MRKNFGGVAMRFGVCMPIEQAEFIAKLGFDYLEVLQRCDNE